MDVKSLQRIDRLNYMLGGVLVIVAALVMSSAGALGVLVGVILSCLNFSIMRRMVEGWMRRIPEQRGPRSYFMMPKMLVLMLAIVAAILYLPITGEGLAIGFSVFLISIAVETVRYISNPPANGKPNAGADDSKT